ncbi:ABC transporter ATP-binding protein [Conexibacter stalactiti]|uniref:ABC transporter ATP-binding protein n=1 Tax=Conexibacter stalactiti TaxID=1940611 RepID=A0ABU4HLB9_9ACTN|nr:ABC transporter ATP-binding protein [Conexibacter stalactiti]MDW5594045.1 ABC transporter ATP-binding protein [Conexibacter stalactiti]MEC5034687.1 ABC transporter ATP-binding protein [Conexibacter stalactiti]
MLDIQNLAKSYGKDGDGTAAIGDVTFSVAEGELVVVVGPSGCGKTTLLRTISGLLRPTSGSVTLRGRPVTEPPAEMAVVFQDYARSLMPWLTVADNVTLPLRNKGMSKADCRAAMEKALASVDLERFGDRYPWELSGGMQQRVAIARALAYEPQILLMDEPFASVDAQTRADLEDLVLEIREQYGMTIVLVTHDIDESVYLGDRVVVLTRRPSTVLESLTIDLPSPRDQIETKQLPAFAHLRAHVYRAIRNRPEPAAADLALTPAHEGRA